MFLSSLSASDVPSSRQGAGIKWKLRNLRPDAKMKNKGFLLLPYCVDGASFFLFSVNNFFLEEKLEYNYCTYSSPTSYRYARAEKVQNTEGFF